MGVDRVAVNPVSLVALQSLRVQLTSSDNEVTGLPINLVAVNGKRIGETVEVLQLALLSEGTRQDLRIQDSDIGQSSGIARNRIRTFLCRLLIAFLFSRNAPVALDLHLVVGKPVVVARRFNVARNVFTFLGSAVRVNRELLNCHRPGHANQAGGNQHQHGGKRWDGKIAQENGCEECSGHDNRDDQQRNLRRQQRIDIGVGTTGESLLLVIQQLIAVQPVRHSLEQHEDTGPGCQLRTSRIGNAGLLPCSRITWADTTKEVMRHQRQQERNNYQDNQRRHDVRPQRQLERIEAQVLAVLRVRLTEGLSV